MKCRLCPKPIPRWRQRLAWKLRCWTDRLDPHGAPRIMSYSFTIERGRGIVFREGNQGCKLAYVGHDEYEKCHR